MDFVLRTQRDHMARLRRMRLKIPVGSVEHLPDSAKIRPAIFRPWDLRGGRLRCSREGVKRQRQRRGGNPDDRGPESSHSINVQFWQKSPGVINAILYQKQRSRGRSSLPDAAAFGNF